MAIRVLKQGSFIFKKTCPYCGCEFEYELEDIHAGVDISKVPSNYSRQTFNPLPPSEKYIDCPFCKKHLLHSTFKADITIPSWRDASAEFTEE